MMLIDTTEASSFGGDQAVPEVICGGDVALTISIHGQMPTLLMPGEHSIV